MHRVCMTVLPVSLLVHICATAVLLANHVHTRWAYVAVDIAIVVFACIKAIQLATLRSSPLLLTTSTQDTAQDPAKRAGGKDPLLLYVAGLGFLLLMIGIRYNYSGYVYDGTVTQLVEHTRIATPFFSDEWAFAGYVHDVTTQYRLPNLNPLVEDSRQLYNFLSPYIILVAGLVVSTGLDIFAQYWILVLIFQIFFLYTCFVWFRSCSISTEWSVVGIALLILIPQSNILPGIWVMLPAFVALPFIFWAYKNFAEYNFTLSYRYKIYGWLHVLLASVLYPPYAVLMAVYAFFALCIRLRTHVFYLLGFIGTLCGMLLVFLYVADIPVRSDTLRDVIRIIISAAVHKQFVISSPAVWEFVPKIFFITACIGLVCWFKTKNVSVYAKGVSVGLIVFLGVLLSSTYVWGIELILNHQRVVFLILIGMVFMTIVLGEYITRSMLYRNSILLTLVIGLQIVSMTLVPYTKMVKWDGVTIHHTSVDKKIESRPLATDLLPVTLSGRVDGLDVGTSTARFLAAPYVSLAIGAMTSLQPISTVESYVSVAGYQYADFMRLTNCEQRYSKAKELGLTYVVVHHTERVMLDSCTQFGLYKELGSTYVIYNIGVDKSKK